LGELAIAALRADLQRTDSHAWIGEVFRLAEKVLKAHPPAEGDHRLRKEALLLLDYPLHVRGGQAWRGELGRFYQSFMASAIKDIGSASVARGLRVWKMYNMGFVVRSRNYAVGFDVHAGYRHMQPLTDRQLRKLASALDVAMVSHPHTDHMDRRFLHTMLEMGKKVILPEGFGPRLNHPNVIRVYRRSEPIRVGQMEIFCHPGWQRLIARNCVYLVSMDGCRVLHTGDNTRHRIYRRLAERDQVDVILANCWARLGTPTGPHHAELIITGHENELTHPPTMRASYRETYGRLVKLIERPGARVGGVMPRCAVLTWGESLHWTPKARPLAHSAAGG
jgi:hypothetical protein